MRPGSDEALAGRLRRLGDEQQGYAGQDCRRAARRLRELAGENAALRRALDELTRDNFPVWGAPGGGAAYGVPMTRGRWLVVKAAVDLLHPDRREEG